MSNYEAKDGLLSEVMQTEHKFQFQISKSSQRQKTILDFQHAILKHFFFFLREVFIETKDI